MSEKFENELNDDCCNGDDCGCGHDHQHEHGHETIMLTLNDDTQLECIVLGIFDVEDQSYIALLPKDKDEVMLYQYNEDEDGINVDLQNIDSDEEFELVSKTFLSMIDQYEE